jgi:7-carboxy-7-deazaguanine synthase
MLKLAEVFTSIQGEGHLTGKLMRFIRFAGCNVRTCPMHPVNKPDAPCDTDWSMSGLGDSERLAAEALAEVGPNGWVCITGGEPLEQPQALADLISELKRRGLLVNIQTSGTHWVTCPWDWLTVSPKGPLVQTFGQELKVVYRGQSDEELSTLYRSSKFWNYYLMPLCSPGLLAGQPASFNIEETIAAVKRMNKLGEPWELTTQAHKWWGVR